MRTMRTACCHTIQQIQNQGVWNWQLPTQESVPTQPKDNIQHKAKTYGNTQEPPTPTPTVIEFHNNIIPTQDGDEELTDPQQELLKWHMRLRHLPFGKLQQLATQNVIPKWLANSKIPMYVGCIYGKATRRSWRDKAVPQNTGDTNMIKNQETVYPLTS